MERDSGSVFADLGFPGADAHLVKAGLVSRIDDIVRDRGITGTRGGAADGPVPARRAAGDFREYSPERLLNALGCDIDIVIRQSRSASEPA